MNLAVVHICRSDPFAPRFRGASGRTSWRPRALGGGQIRHLARHVQDEHGVTEPARPACMAHSQDVVRLRHGGRCRVLAYRHPEIVRATANIINSVWLRHATAVGFEFWRLVVSERTRASEKLPLYPISYAVELEQGW